MKVELRKFQAYPRLSGETNAFNAELWIDGVKAADASNNGHGGSNILHFRDHALAKRFHDWCKSQPPVDGLEMDEDFYVSLLVEDEINKQFLKKKGKSHVVFSLPGKPKGEYYTVKIGNSRPAAEQFVLSKHPDAIIYDAEGKGWQA